MLKFVVQIHPFGDSSQAYDIREVFVGNMMKTNAKGQHLYHAWLKDPRSKSPRPSPDTKVWHWREDGDLCLVGKVSTSLFKKSKE